MIPIINKSIVPLKYRIRFTKHCPSKYDMLYELTEFLEAEHKEEFNEWELKNKTKSRFGTLEEIGFKNRWLKEDDLQKSIELCGKNTYKTYLEGLLKKKENK